MFEKLCTHDATASDRMPLDEHVGSAHQLRSPTLPRPRRRHAGRHGRGTRSVGWRRPSVFRPRKAEAVAPSQVRAGGLPGRSDDLAASCQVSRGVGRGYDPFAILRSSPGSSTFRSWSWGESNPRPSGGCRPRYDRSRLRGFRAATPAGRLGLRPPPGLSRASVAFPTVSVLSCRHPPLLLPGCGEQAPGAIAGPDDSLPTG